MRRCSWDQRSSGRGHSGPEGSAATGRETDTALTAIRRQRPKERRMGWIDIRCPGCKQNKPVSPGSKYKRCNRCSTPHCIMESGTCKVPGCSGWLEEETNR